MITAIGIPTLKGDGINTPPLWSPTNASAQFYFQTALLKSLGIPTINGDGINTPNLWTGANSATLRYVVNGNRNMGLFDQTQWRGYTFVIDPATLQPQLPLSTTFPSAQ